MTRWRFAIGLCLVAVLWAGTAWSQEDPPPPAEGQPIEGGERQRAVEGQEDARQHEPGTEGSATEPDDDEAAEGNTRTEESEGEQNTVNGAQDGQQMVAYTFWLTMFTGVLAFFTVLLAGAALWQASIARGAARRQLRAYLRVKPFEIPGLIPGSEPIVEFDIINNGQTPAYKVRYVAVLDVLVHPLADTQGDLVRPRAGQITPMQALHKDEEYRGEATMAEPLSEDDVRDMFKEGNTNRLYMMGLVIYEDAFKIERRTRFCYYLIRTDTGMRHPSGKRIVKLEWAFSHVHNDAD